MSKSIYRVLDFRNVFLTDKDDNAGESASEPSLVHVWVTMLSLHMRVFFFNWCSLNICSFNVVLRYLVIVTQYAWEYDGNIFLFCPLLAQYNTAASPCKAYLSFGGCKRIVVFFGSWRQGFIQRRRFRLLSWSTHFPFFRLHSLFRRILPYSWPFHLLLSLSMGFCPLLQAKQVLLVPVLLLFLQQTESFSEKQLSWGKKKQHEH